MTRPRRRVLLCLCALAAAPGCVRRTLTVTSNPPGALAYLNDQEIGRTPVTREFTWYGDYDVELRKDGYQTVKAKTPVIAPWWQWVPFDLFAEPFPLTDRHTYSYSLVPLDPGAADAGRILPRAEHMREQLESGANPPHAVKPTTKPTTRPARRK
jgi:hypothetical protein